MALRIEGYIDDPLDFQFVGTTGRSARNNNPLNLEYRPGSYQDKYGATLEPTGGGKDTAPRFAMFPSMVAGYMAGLDQIRMDQARGHTLASFVSKFAPSFENPTSDLIAQYGRATGAAPDTPLANIPAEQLIQPMLKRESSTRIVNLDEVNRQLASYHQMNKPQQQQQEPLKIVGYADEAQPEQPGFLGQAWTGLKEQLGSYLPKYGSFISGAPEATYQQEYQKWKEALGPPEAQPETWWGKVGRGLGQGVGMIPEFAGLAALAPELGIPGMVGRMTQSALPFAASSILNPEAGVGDLAHSVAMGAGLGAIPPAWGRMLRVPAAAGIGGGLGYLSSGDAKQAAADATVLGILSALHGGVPRVPEMGQTETRPDMRGNVPGQRLLPYQERQGPNLWEPPTVMNPEFTDVTPSLIPGMGRVLPEPQRLLPGEQRLLPGPAENLPTEQKIIPAISRRLPVTEQPGYLEELFRQRQPVNAPAPEKVIPAKIDTWKKGWNQVHDPAADVATIPGEPLYVFKNGKAVITDGEEGGYIVQRDDGTYVFNSQNQTATFDNLEKAQKAYHNQAQPTLTPKAKEPWEMTQPEYVQKRFNQVADRAEEVGNIKIAERLRRGTEPGRLGDYKRNHQQIVEQALAQGKPVPPDVLKDYPDLAWKGETITREQVNQETYDLLKRKIEEAKGRRAWNEIPPSFEKQAVKKLYEELKPHFKDVVGARIGASKATTFDSLLQKVNQAQEEFGKRISKVKGETKLYGPETGPTPDSLRAGLNLEDLKFLGRKVADLGDWLNKKFKEDIRWKSEKPGNQGTPRDISITPKDLKMWTRYWQMPEWLQKEHPNFLNVAINDWRQKLYNNLKNPWFKEVSPIFKLPRQQWDSLKNLIVEADQMSRRMLKTGANREQIDQAVNNLKYQYGPEVQQAAESWWRTGSRIWRTIDEIYSRMDMPQTDLDKMRREMGYVPYYFPHMRFGKYLVMARQGKDTLYAEGATNRLTRDRLMADLKKQYPEAKVDFFESKGIAEEVFFGLNDAHAAQLAKAALAKAGKLTPEVEEGVMQALANSLKERGFGRQFIQQKNIPGFETDDFHRVLSNYISGAAGFISKLKAAPEHIKALGAIDARKQPRLYSYAEKYVRHSLQNSSKIDEIAGKMRGLMFHYFLGLNPKSAVLNLTQNIATGAPVLSTLKVKNPGMKILSAVKDIASDGKGYWDMMHGRDGEFKHLKDNEVRALKTAMNNGWLDDVFTEEMMGMVGSRLGTSLNKFEKASHFLFGQAESLNRSAMFLASFRELTKKGIDFNNAVKKANELTTMSHFAYGKYNLPEPVRDLGPIGRTIYTFRSFSHNYALMLRHLAKNDPAAFGRAIRNLSLLGGLKAVPLVGVAFGVYKALTGQDLWQESVQDKENNLPYLLARFGIPGLVGIDMSGSVSIEVMKDLKQWSDLPKELLGAVGGIGENLANAADSYKRGDYYRMIENLSPQAVRNVMGAYRKSTEGVMTKTGRQVFDAQGQPVKLSTGEAVEKGLGFQPIRPTIQREISDYLYEMRQNQQDMGDKWATQIINALRSNDKGTYNQVMTEVLDYNQRALKRGEPPIEIDNYLKRRMQPQLPGPKKWLPYYQKLQ